MKYFFYKSSVGDIGVSYDDKGITKIVLPYDSLEALDGLEYMEDSVISKYFEDYFHGVEPGQVRFNINITPFQGKVFDVLLKTRIGDTITYGDIAKMIGSAPRAIGQALKKNPVPILIPCHRVLGKNWEGGFAGETTGERMDFKRLLLEMERKTVL